MAVGNTLRRLVSKLLCTRLKPSLKRLFEPLQTGVAAEEGSSHTSGAPEADLPRASKDRYAQRVQFDRPGNVPRAAGA